MAHVLLCHAAVHPVCVSCGSAQVSNDILHLQLLYIIFLILTRALSPSLFSQVSTEYGSFKRDAEVKLHELQQERDEAREELQLAMVAGSVREQQDT